MAIFRGNVEWKGGRAHFGNIAVGGQSKLSTGALENGCRVNKYTKEMLDFDAVKAQLESMSKELAGMKSTLKSQSIKDTTWFADFEPTANLQVVNVDDPKLFMGKVRINYFFLY